LHFDVKVDILREKKSNRLNEKENINNNQGEFTRHHLDKHQFVHHNHYNRNRDRMKMCHQVDDMVDDDVDFENANKNTRKADVYKR